jgi:DNA-binding FadR family transcriptional regulator
MADQDSVAVQPRVQGERSFGNSLRVPKTAEVIANHIRSRIVRGELREGDFLPPEGQLMASLNISRPTLREAFRILEAERLISVIPGSRTGARVHQPQVEAVARQAGILLQTQGTTVADIYQARLAIEPFVARRLAERRDVDAAAKLAVEAQRLTDLVNERRYTDFMIGLVGFHRLLVELGGNHTLLFVTHMLQDVTARYQVERLQRRPLPDEEQRRRSLWGIKSFWRLIEIIKEGDGDAAEAHWRLHVTNANKSWVGPEDNDRLISVID